MTPLPAGPTDRHTPTWRLSATAPLRNRIRRGAIMAAVAATLATPASALAANPPTILTAGVDAADQLYATWTLAPGTTFDHVNFATVSTPDAALPDFFLDGNFAGYSSSTSNPQGAVATSHTSSFPSARDRRYYTKVTAAVTGVANMYVTSVVWVIDEAKPEIAGAAPLGPIPPTGKPATGRPLAGGTTPPPLPQPPPPPPPPAAAVTVRTAPTTFASLRTRGARVAVGCTGAPCTAVATLTLSGSRIGRKAATLPANTTRTLVVKPTSAGNRRLRGRPRAKLKISGRATPQGGAAQTASKTFTVRR